MRATGLVLLAAALAAMLVWQLVASGDRSPSSAMTDPNGGGDRSAAETLVAEAPARPAAVGGERDRVEPAPGAGRERPATGAGGSDRPGRTALEIEVVDAAGAPAAGVPVWLAIADGERVVRVVWRGTTAGPAGAVRLTDLRDAVGEPAWQHGRLAATVALPLAPRPAIAFDVEQPPAEPILLTLPPTGRLAVTLEHPDPSRVRGATVRVRDAAAGDAAAASGIAHEPTVLFEHVGLGLDLEVSADIPGSNMRPSVTARGPVAAGETAFVTLPAAARRPVLVALLVGEDRAALAETRVEVHLHAAQSRSTATWSSSVVTGGDGVLRLELFDELELDAERDLRLTTADGHERSVRLSLPSPLRDGENDLGTLVLESAPRLAAGVVVDRAGAPIDAAAIVVERRSARDGATGWEPTGLPQTLTDGRGRFAIHGRVDAAEIALSIAHPRYLRLEHLPVAFGADGQRIVLDAAGAIAGSLRCGELDPTDHVRILARAEPDAGGEPAGQARAASDGSFLVDELTPGSYRVEVALRGRREPLHAVPGVVVAGGEPTRDPRLADLELAGLARELRFRVVDPAGGIVDDAMALIVPPAGAGERIEGVFVADGVGSVLVADAAIGLFVWARGHRASMVPVLADGQDVVLGPGLAVALRVPQPVLEAAAGFSLRCALRPAEARFAPDSLFEITGPGRSSSYRGGLPWDELLLADVRGGIARLTVLEPGEHSVSWWAVGGAGTRRYLGRHPIAVADRVREQAFAAELDPARVREALR